MIREEITFPKSDLKRDRQPYRDCQFVIQSTPVESGINDDVY